MSEQTSERMYACWVKMDGTVHETVELWEVRVEQVTGNGAWVHAVRRLYSSGLVLSPGPHRRSTPMAALVATFEEGIACVQAWARKRKAWIGAFAAGQRKQVAERLAVVERLEAEAVELGGMLAHFSWGLAPTQPEEVDVVAATQRGNDEQGKGPE